MLSISWRSILQVIAGASLIVAIICISNPEYGHWIPVAAAIVAFAGSLVASNTPISIPTSEKTKYIREERNLRDLLNRVKNNWIEDVLEQSIKVLIELGLEGRRDAVLSRQGIELQRPGHPNRLLPPGTEIVDVFDEVGQTLLILSEPGSGKTTRLLELARDTIARAEEDAKHRIPVVFNLSSWTDTKQPIADWLVDELYTNYGYISEEIASDWIKNENLLLLLDGLDEVLPERREACARAINDFRHERGLTPLVVCCRSEAYETLSTRLDLKGTISLQPLTKEQIDDYLDRMGQGLNGLRTTLKDDSELCELAQTPLMLIIMALAYRGMSVNVQPPGNINARRKHVFDNYVERMFKPRTHRTISDVSDDPKPDGERFSKEETLHWLSWLAKRMSEHGQTVFLIEHMQPDWLPTRAQQWRVTGGVAAMIGLLSWLLAGLLVWGAELLTGLLIGLLIGLLGFRIGYSEDIRPVETLRFSWSAMIPTSLLAGLLAGLVFGMLAGLLTGLVFGLVLGLVFGLLKGLDAGELLTRTFPNEGVHRSAHVALLTGLLFGLLIGWLMGLFYGLPIGLLTGLLFGGRACIQHYVLRIMLWRNDFAPLHYVRFLDYAADRIFLRNVGGGYIFVHRLLLEYFASLEPEEEGG